MSLDLLPQRDLSPPVSYADELRPVVVEPLAAESGV
jgi:hypothetical protein